MQPAVSSVPAGETLATLNIKWLANLSVIVMTRMRRRIDVMTRMGEVIIAMSNFIVKPSLRQVVVVKLIIVVSNLKGLKGSSM